MNQKEIKHDGIEENDDFVIINDSESNLSLDRATVSMNAQLKVIHRDHFVQHRDRRSPSEREVSKVTIEEETRQPARPVEDKVSSGEKSFSIGIDGSKKKKKSFF